MLASLAADRARLAAIDAQLEIEMCIRAISKLFVAKERVQAGLDSYKYPFLTLPTEIILEIFHQFLPAYPLCPPLVGPPSPTLLTHICQLWRDIALGTPALWRAIDLSEVHPWRATNSAVRSRIDICATWFSRSRSYPLSLRDVGNGPEMGGTGFMNTVLPHRSRLEHLSLDYAPSSYPILAGAMPLLRSLRIMLGYREALSVLEAPSLRSATLNEVTARAITLPWSQLTSLTLYSVYPHDCFPILEQTLHLVHCHLVLHQPHPPAVPEILPSTSLPQLETLIMLAGEGTSPVTGYLHTFVVPALSMLQVPEQFLGPDPIEYLKSFLSDSGCNLRSVVITGHKIAFKNSYRRAFPSIREITFRRYYEFESYSDVEVDEDSNALE